MNLLHIAIYYNIVIKNLTRNTVLSILKRAKKFQRLVKDKTCFKFLTIFKNIPKIAPIFSIMPKAEGYML